MVSPYLPVVREEASPADERRRGIPPNLVTADIRRFPTHRTDFIPSTLLWMLSGEVRPAAHTTVRQIDDVGRIELPLEDKPVAVERPPALGAKGQKGRGGGNGRKNKSR